MILIVLFVFVCFPTWEHSGVYKSSRVICRVLGFIFPVKETLFGSPAWKICSVISVPSIHCMGSEEGKKEEQVLFRS